MPAIQQEGHFQCAIVDYGLKEMDSGSVAVAIRCAIKAAWNGETWDDWSQYEEQTADGDLWIVKKDKTINNLQVEALCRYAGWDGTIVSVVNKTWEPRPCRIEVRADTYKDQTRYKINWLAAYDSTPGGMGHVDENRGKELAALYGTPLRAVAASFAHASAKPGVNGPKVPPPKSTGPKAKSNPTEADYAAAEKGIGDIPF